MKLEDKVGQSAAPIRREQDVRKVKASSDTAEQLRAFFSLPLIVFGRKYRAFCNKDDAMVYWCEGGGGLEKISLATFCERHIEVELNATIKVAKWISRFELGLTSTVSLSCRRRCSLADVAFADTDRRVLAQPGLSNARSTFRQPQDELRDAVAHL